ncbi:hypothetical protein [Gilliamella apicola]|uniref:hypothetical protein n=1 Tax=Gilliamella apicola TaxID=1196095 RepID=UPI0009FD6E93|nr:hypothetical protein [Gilliamella apicola]ORF46727.1 hypothetical protein B5800_02020 [Gilliamella apicola]ORF48440.1 hypothetical protein B5803_11225 [Gilliamella apicola]ORF50410.1 hypothetical protein B5799_01195 [Gilliamella apicola]ORF51227.1 hypothetical protein B5802_11595 [Gilliamella apicola]ORF55863.1 hypothetical protein B5798_01825 [Gilliamella apicola]
MHYDLQYKKHLTYCSISSSSNERSLISQFSLFFKRKFRLLSRLFLSLLILLTRFLIIFLPFSCNSQALSVETRNVIQGNKPYFTLDGGQTISSIYDMISISLSDGRKFIPYYNGSTYGNPIELPDFGQSFADIVMIIPADADSIPISTLVAPPYNYWGDDDGDGDVTATGNINLSIVDAHGVPVKRNEVPDICRAPYLIRLSASASILSTRYGVPNKRVYPPVEGKYYISPKAMPKVCFAKPSLKYGRNNESVDGYYEGPASIWNTLKGFLSQSTNASSYHLNFPTTGANGLYFDLDVRASKSFLSLLSSLSWAPVVSPNGDIKAITKPDSSGTSVRVLLEGPAAKESQMNVLEPGNIHRPSLPQVFEFVGRDSSGKAIAKYGFELKQWFVNATRTKDQYKNYQEQISWCRSIGYRMPEIKDLTNAVSGDKSGATPASPGNHYQRRIGAGFFTEWGSVSEYTDAGFTLSPSWVSDEKGYLVYAAMGHITYWGPHHRSSVTCVSP